jgi:hexosaminidase
MTGDFNKLEGIYIQRLLDIASNLSVNSVVWQEVFDNGVFLPQDTLVHIWTGNLQEELQKVNELNTLWNIVPTL